MNGTIEDYDSIEAYVDDNREDLIRVLEHSSDTFARACAWTLLDAGSEDPEIEQLESELATLRERRDGEVA